MKSFEAIYLEYRQKLADGTPTPSIQPHNGKDPNRIDKKILHTVGPRKKNNEKLDVGGSLLTFPELEELGLKDIMDTNLPMVYRNIKNSGADIQVFRNPQGMIMGRVIKRSPKTAK